MIRIFFIVGVVSFVSICVSCDTFLSQDDPLFYQMSKADSTRCMEEVLGEICEEARENQRQKIDFMKHVTCVLWRSGFVVRINRSGEIETDNLDIASISDSLVAYILFNRNLTGYETTEASMNPTYSGSSSPFYNHFGSEEIKDMIKNVEVEFEEIRAQEGADSALVAYFASKVVDRKLMLKGLELMRAKSFPQRGSSQVVVSYQSKTEKSEEVLREVAKGVYQIRNYECLRYFNETYLNLYDRAQKRKRKIDLEKLELLKMIQPNSLFDEDLSKMPLESPPLPVEYIPQ